MYELLKDFFSFNINSFEYISENSDDTIKFSYEFAKFLKEKDITVLNGELGAGKTIFVSGIAKHFGFESQLSSPTFTIVNEYYGKNNEKIYHFDVYRLNSEIDFLNGIGTDYFENGICIIEWGDIIKNILPKNTIYIDIKKDSENINKRYFSVRRN